ncbi:hypothetical protein D3C86_2051010 [compost metagenome]
MFNQTSAFDLVVRQRAYREAHALVRVFHRLTQRLTFRARWLNVTDDSNHTITRLVFDRVLLDANIFEVAADVVFVDR